jgi:hypothetical protein
LGKTIELKPFALTRRICSLTRVISRSLIMNRLRASLQRVITLRESRPKQIMVFALLLLSAAPITSAQRDTLTPSPTPCLTACPTLSPNPTPTRISDLVTPKIALSATGGTSKGSYQAGIDWTLVEFLRRTRTLEFREKLGAQGFKVKDGLDLAAASGASAGNLDALLASITWCTRAVGPSPPGLPNIKAEESLFWTVWVGTSMSKLLDLDRNKRIQEGDVNGGEDELAPFNRSQFFKEYKDSIRKFMKNAIAQPGCKVPLGIALTRQVPVEVRVQKDLGLKVPVSRFSAVVEVGEAEKGIEVRRLLHEEKREDTTPAAAALGALALPRIGGTACKDQAEIFDWLFNVVMASSSFPVAFSPRSVCYVHGGLEPFEDSALANKQAEARFMDGGVFDNEPVALAIGLVELAGSLSEPKARMEEIRATGKSLTVLATSGGHVLRGSLEDRGHLREESDRLGRLLGLAGTEQMLGGALASAQQYELHSLARQLKHNEFVGEGKNDTPPLVISSTRGDEIVSAMVGGFAGFFGQPFREYDFYSGIYDGLHLLAGTYVSLPDEQSVKSVLKKLIVEDTLDLSDAAKHVLKWRFFAEFGEDLESSAPAKSRSRLGTLRAIHDALRTLVPEDPLRPAPTCAGSSQLEKLMCSGGFKPFIDTLSKRYGSLGPASNDGKQCARPDDQNPQCFEDDDFRRIVADPYGTVNGWMVRTLDRLATAEKKIPGDAHAGPIEALLMFYRGTDFKYRPKGLGKGWSFNPSSGYLRLGDPSPRATVASLVGMVSPNYIAEFGDGRVVGWRLLTWHPTRPLIISSSLDWVQHRCTAFVGFRAECADATAHTSSWYGGVSLGYFVPKLPLGPFAPDTIEARWDVPRNSNFSHAISASARLLKGKVFVDFRREQRLPRGAAKGEAINEFRIGISDLNGMLYWLVR